MVGERVKVRKAEWYQETKLERRLKKYNLDPSDYKWILSIQEGRCKICKKNLEMQGVIDHDHETGKVRGVLCSPCNLGLGNFQDNPTNLENAITYLQKGNAATP